MRSEAWTCAEVAESRLHKSDCHGMQSEGVRVIYRINTFGDLGEHFMRACETTHTCWEVNISQTKPGAACSFPTRSVSKVLRHCIQFPTLQAQTQRNLLTLHRNTVLVCTFSDMVSAEPTILSLLSLATSSFHGNGRAPPVVLPATAQGVRRLRPI